MVDVKVDGVGHTEGLTAFMCHAILDLKLNVDAFFEVTCCHTLVAFARTRWRRNTMRSG